MPTPADLLRRELAADPARPFVTFYDDATGERVELSVATFDNWVAKTAGLLRDGLAVEPGEAVGLLLPLHWQTPVWLAACWAAGAVAVVGAGVPGCDVVVCGPDDVPAAAGYGARETVALALRPLGGGFATPLPPGVLDYGAEVASYPDRFAPVTPPDPEAPALVDAGRACSGVELVEHARATAARWGVRAGHRLLTALDPTGPGLDAALPVPLAASASVVLCRHLDPGALPRRTATEHVTAVLVDGDAPEPPAPPAG